VGEKNVRKSRQKTSVKAQTKGGKLHGKGPSAKNQPVKNKEQPIKNKKGRFGQDRTEKRRNRFLSISHENKENDDKSRKQSNSSAMPGSGKNTVKK